MILEKEYKTVLEGSVDTCNCINCRYGIVEIFTNKVKSILKKEDFRTILKGSKEKLHLMN